MFGAVAAAVFLIAIAGPALVRGVRGDPGSTPHLDVTETNMFSLIRCLEEYREANGHYPAEAGVFDDLFEATKVYEEYQGYADPDDLSMLEFRYMSREDFEEILLDGWGRRFIYRSPPHYCHLWAEGKEPFPEEYCDLGYELVSFGADGEADWSRLDPTEVHSFRRFRWAGVVDRVDAGQ